jgi:hypothetical protein
MIVRMSLHVEECTAMSTEHSNPSFRDFGKRLLYCFLQTFTPRSALRITSSLLAPTAVAAASESDFNFKRNTPATKWTEALPLVNERIGAMVALWEAERLLDQRKHPLSGSPFRSGRFGPALQKDSDRTNSARR